MESINSFDGEYRWLSNFWPAPVKLNGIIYPTVENAYQAAKTISISERTRFVNIAPGKAKKFGKYVTIRDDWEIQKLGIMKFLVRQKFEDGELYKKLKETVPKELIEGNTWGDIFWGQCRGIGQNHLGKILMNIRDKE